MADELYCFSLKFKEEQLEEFYKESDCKYLKSITYFYASYLLFFKLAVYIGSFIIGIPIPLFIFIPVVIITLLVIFLNYQNKLPQLSFVVLIQQFILTVIARDIFIKFNMEVFENLESFTSHVISLCFQLFILNMVAWNIVRWWVTQSLIFFTLFYMIYEHIQYSAQIFAVLTLSFVPFIFYTIEKQQKINIFQIYMEKIKNKEWSELFNRNRQESIFIFQGFSNKQLEEVKRIQRKSINEMLQFLIEDETLIIKNKSALREINDNNLQRFSQLKVNSKTTIVLPCGTILPANSQITLLELIFYKLINLDKINVSQSNYDKKIKNSNASNIRPKSSTLNMVHQHDDVIEEYFNCRFKQNDIESKRDLSYEAFNKIFFDIEITQINFDGKQALLLKMKNTSKERELQRNRDLSELKDKILNTITHNLKTPLNGIILKVDNIINNYSTEQNFFEATNDIKQNSEWLLCLINDMIDYSKINLKSLILNYKQIRLENIINEVQFIISNQVRKDNVQLLTQYEGGNQLKDLEIYSDFQRLKQILLNIVANSIQYTFKGKIIISVQQTQRETIKFIVEDTGIGMSQEQINHLMGSTQINSLFTDSQEFQNGAGIGIMITRSLIRQLGPGDIFFQSQVDIGTYCQFEIYKNSSIQPSKKERQKKLFDNNKIYYFFLFQKDQSKDIQCFQEFKEKVELIPQLLQDGKRDSKIIEFGQEQADSNIQSTNKYIQPTNCNLSQEENYEERLMAQMVIIQPKIFIQQEKLASGILNFRLEQNEVIKQNEYRSFSSESSLISHKTIQIQELKKEVKEDQVEVDEKKELKPTENKEETQYEEEYLQHQQIKINIQKRRSKNMKNELAKAVFLIEKFKRILIVDDTYFNIEALQEFLLDISPNLNIDKAFNGEEAVHKVCDEGNESSFSPSSNTCSCPPIDLVFMDINMPVMDGIKASRIIKAKKGNSVRIISVTAFDENQNKQQFQEAGIEAVIPKPVNIFSFINALQEL